MSILDRINSPADLRALAREDLPMLATDLRQRMVDVCSRTGGHIGAGLTKNSKNGTLPTP